MNRLYTYVTKPNTVVSEGIKTPVDTSVDKLRHYFGRAKSEDKEDIINYLESLYEGRSRAISVLTETIPPLCNKLKGLVEARELFALDIDKISADDIVENIYRIDGSQNILLGSKDEIDFTPIDWSIVSDNDNFLFSKVRHYMLVLKGGILLPKYIKSGVE